MRPTLTICAITAASLLHVVAPLYADGPRSTGSSADAIAARQSDMLHGLGLTGHLGRSEQGLLLSGSISPRELRGATFYLEGGFARGRHSGVAAVEKVEHEANPHYGIGLLFPLSGRAAASVRERVPEASVHLRASMLSTKSKVTDRLTVGDRSALASLKSRVHALALGATVPSAQQGFRWLGSVGAAQMREVITFEIDGSSDISTFMTDRHVEYFATASLGLLFEKNAYSAYAIAEYATEAAVILGVRRSF